MATCFPVTLPTFMPFSAGRGLPGWLQTPPILVVSLASLEFLIFPELSQEWPGWTSVCSDTTRQFSLTHDPHPSALHGPHEIALRVADCPGPGGGTLRNLPSPVGKTFLTQKGHWALRQMTRP